MPHDYTKKSTHTWILVFQDESQNTPSSTAPLKQSTATKQSSAALVKKKMSSKTCSEKICNSTETFQQYC